MVLVPAENTAELLRPTWGYPVHEWVESEGDEGWRDYRWVEVRLWHRGMERAHIIAGQVVCYIVIPGVDVLCV